MDRAEKTQAKWIAGLAAILALWAAPTHAQQLWQKAMYGMTVAQVQQAMPETQPYAGPKTTHEGGIEELAQEGVEIAGLPFRAAFFFADHKLTGVVLDATSVTDYRSALQHKAKLLPALEAKYGVTTDVKRTAISIIEMTTWRWVSGDTLIQLNVGAIEREGHVNVAYDPLHSDEAKKAASQL